MLKACRHICYAIPITRDRVAAAAFSMRGIMEVWRHRLADTVGRRSSQLAVGNGLASQRIGMPRATHSIRHEGETVMTVVGPTSKSCGDGRLETGRQLGPHPSAVVHLDACALAPLPDRSKVQPAHRCPAPIPARAACARALDGSHAVCQRVTQRLARRPGRSPTRCRPARRGRRVCP